MTDLPQLEKQEQETVALFGTGPRISPDLLMIGKQALEFTNSFRKSKGLYCLKWHQSLCEIGIIHSKDMAENKFDNMCLTRNLKT